MLIETLKREINRCGKTRYQIAKESGVSEAQLCRFMKGQSFYCQTADILLRYFGYELRKKKKAR
jgi:transcriptional regulator with XRE-family HTH domain